MKVAFPVRDDNGLESLVDDHYGVSEHFLIVDLDTHATQRISNQKLGGKSTCKSSVFGKDVVVDAVVTRCIGDGSQRGLQAAGIRIYTAREKTVGQNLALLAKGELKPFHIFDLCQGKKNKKQGGCGHHH